ncbi:MAG: endopeptidase La [Candidatus Krumholzibacteriales bacterium]
MNEDKEYLKQIPEEIGVVPINDGVVYPGMLAPLVLSDENLINLVDNVLDSSKVIGVFTQKDREVSDPGPDDIYNFGCAMLIQKMARFPDGHIRIIGQGLTRIKIREFTRTTNPMRSRIDVIREKNVSNIEISALVGNIQSAFISLIDKTDKYPNELKKVVMNISQPGQLADFIATNLSIGIEEKMAVLEAVDPKKRMGMVFEYIDSELEIAKIGEKIQKDMHQEMDREQREYFLRKKMEAIKKELGEDDISVDAEDLKEKIEQTDLPERVAEAAEQQWRRLSRMSPASAEYTVTRTYLDWLLTIPWKVSTPDIMDVNRAQKILDKDHYDLDTVKERILEFLSVRKLKGGRIGSILCFVGPPGVGKTSLGQSVARALGRKFTRISLGGIKDEAEIRGHRRTYVGALPGRIIQGIKNTGSNNPVFMLDEVDKIGRDFRGDPTSALLEVLDPEQNSAFQDNYLNLPFDLSSVLFITTANITETIPAPLMDRMEVMELPGYITSEKLQIARKYLIPRQFEKNGVQRNKLEISDEAIIRIIDSYTWEAGVRNLERSIAAIMRKVARKLTSGKKGPYRVIPRNLKSYLGPREYTGRLMMKQPRLGVATGMAKSTSGGVILFVEAAIMKGNGRLKLTGRLGNVMKESAEAALSFIRAKYGDSIQGQDLFQEKDIHIHIPAGAIPKDGPSAGIALAISVASIILDRKVRNDIAVTGEITLTGNVLPVGGIKDKVIAAHRAGIREILLPGENKKDLEEIPERITGEIRFRFVNKLTEALKIALIDQS